MPSTRLVGIGIDLISWNRVRRFLANHSFEFLKRLFTPSEQTAFHKTKSPVEFFARSFTAKEAYFKACGGSIMGEQGFRGIEILIEKKNRFQVGVDLCVHPPDQTGRHVGRPLQPKTVGKFFSTPDGIGAQIFVWK